jgi:hypothetical protein
MEQTTTYRPIDAEWRRWIAENVLLNKEPSSITAVMIRDGFDPKEADAEVRAAVDHPYLVAARQSRTPNANQEWQLKKRDWVLECTRRAARLSPNFGTVPRVIRPSRDEFLENFYLTNRPVVIKGAMDDWPAVDLWTREYLKQKLGDRLVEVQANRSSDDNYERNSGKLRKTMPFGEYVDIVESAGNTNDWYITAQNSGKNTESLKELWDDIVPFPEYLTAADETNRGFFWYGPGGTITPLHHDLTNNFMAQVRGSKRVRLIAPYELPRLYNDRHCYSLVDLTRPDLAKFPLFKDVTVIDVEIGPRDLLFLPVGWWHFVQSLSTSITITFTNFVYGNDFFSFYPRT